MNWVMSFSKKRDMCTTDIDYGNDMHSNMIQGALVELRGLERGVQSERWGEIAELVAEMIYAINTQ